MKILFLLPILAACFIGSVLARNPGVIVAIRQPTIDDVKNAMFPEILAQLQGLKIPDFSSGSFTISNIVINDLHMVPKDVNVDFENGYIAATSSNLAIDISLHIDYSLPFGLSISADTTASASQSDLSFNVALAYSATSFASVTISNTNININNLDIEIDGILGQIASLIINLIAPLLTSSIDSSLAGSLQSSVQQELTQALATVSGKYSIPGTPLGGDYGLSASPVLTTDYMSLSVDGTFYDSNQPFVYPPIPQPVTLPTIDPSTNENVQFFISDYVFNSACYGLYVANFLRYTITPNMIPSESPIGLNTTSLGQVFPEVLSYYGPDLPCQLLCSADDTAPTAGLNTSGLFGNVSGDCILQVQANGTWSDAFTANSVVTFLVDVSVDNYTIYGNISSLSMGDITITDSNIGPVDTSGIDNVIQGILAIGIPIIDKTVLKNGFPIPAIPQTNLSSAEITLNTGYLKIGATPIFSEDAFKNLPPIQPEEEFNILSLIM